MHTWRNCLVEFPDGQWAVPYTGMSTLHNVDGEFHDGLFPNHREIQIRYALWQPHRLCGIEAEAE